MDTTDLTGDIKAEICKAISLLGGDSSILGIIGSWRDTWTDEQVLETLKAWNEGEADKQGK